MSEDVREKKLSPAQLKLIECLLTTGNVTRAAAAAGVSRKTVYVWMNDETFVTALHQAEAEAVSGLSRALAGLGDAAAGALRDALEPHQKISVRLRASEVVIGNLLRIRELVDIEARLAALEGNQ